MTYFCRASLVWLVVLLVVWRVESTTDCAPSSKLFTIKTPQDVADLSECVTFTGNIVVAADGPEDISLDSLWQISGNIDIENVANLRSLSSKSLESVTSLTLNNLPLLEELTLPALKNFSSLKLFVLPKLDECEIATGAVEGEIQEISVYNTSLKSLDWVTWPVGASLNISANGNLASFKISYNSINAGSAITLSSNPSLDDIDVSLLSGIYGGLDVSGNNVGTLSFTKLESIGGFVQLSGDYTNISMPALNQINGALSVESTSDIETLCNSLKEKKLAGHYDCTTNTQIGSDPSQSGGSNSTSAAPTTISTAPSDASDTSSNSQEKAAIGGAIAGISLCALVGVFVWFYHRRRIRKQVKEITPRSKGIDIDEADSIELTSPAPSYRASRRASLKELESPTVWPEMAADIPPQELPAAWPPPEMDGDAVSVRTASSRRKRRKPDREPRVSAGCEEKPMSEPQQHNSIKAKKSSRELVLLRRNPIPASGIPNLVTASTLDTKNCIRNHLRTTLVNTTHSLH
ncbi:hypothetical protein K458DRAFT_485381 [Lentithecium fluviatile CBS 122367]|uniref:Receptor L-domain domain-containing protein n=1 Tax=Lentithecium fluviatile CBS 122367 TaxID=1168545 RepID=A0A6G1J9J4_9PLEO|nr:hypothetical protein K458DRAFT_485381 [Lentithecium fluviatile CBS 122367]